MLFRSRPVERVSKGNAIFTLSPKELIMPLLSRANIRQNLIHVGAQLCQKTSWTDYSEYKSKCQDLLQQHLLDFLYSESSWRYKILQKSNVSKDKNYITPLPLDIVAIKLDQGRDFKMGIVTDTSDPPRVKVRTFVNGKRQEPLFHPLTLGLLYRDPPEQTSSEIRLENDARDRAKKGLEKAWSDSPEQVIEAERELLSEQYANLVTEGLHKGRVNLISGLVEPFLITNLPSKESIAKENVFISNHKASILMFMQR